MRYRNCELHRQTCDVFSQSTFVYIGLYNNPKVTKVLYNKIKKATRTLHPVKSKNVYIKDRNNIWGHCKGIKSHSQ